MNGEEPLLPTTGESEAMPARDESRPFVLVIDDRDDLLRFCLRSLVDEYAFFRAPSWRRAAALLREGWGVAAILLDRDFSHAPPEELLGPPAAVRDEGLSILRWLREKHPDIPILMVTGFREQRAAIEAADLGSDFLTWQDLVENPDVLSARLGRALALNGNATSEIIQRFREVGVVSDSPAFRRVLVSLYHALPGSAPILLLGDTGTGKDTLAYAAHTISGDFSRPYVSVNVASLNAGLIENELFGHAPGAFTGAGRAAPGRIRSADGGTLFLNEVGELPTEAQAKLLTVLERGEVVPLGDIRSYPSRFRLITATSQDLKARIQEKCFRLDLYHRIAWHTIVLPRLRERREDIPALVQTYLREEQASRSEGIVGITREAVDYLCELEWEGNVRELRAVLAASAATARYVITLPDVREVTRRNENTRIRPIPDLATGPSEAVPANPGPSHAISGDCEEAVFGSLTYRELTGRYFAYLARKSGGRLPDVARRAGIARATAYEWRDRYRPIPPS